MIPALHRIWNTLTGTYSIDFFGIYTFYIAVYMDIVGYNFKLFRTHLAMKNYFKKILVSDREIHVSW